MIGQTIGKYRVQDRIGRGGMGTVYLAKDETLHREVAIKVLNSELNDPEIARRFRSEAITVARLSHPGIATIYELFEHDGQWLMVMEFVRGETLERLVERSGSLPVDRAVDLCSQALTALAHAHSMGVVHRDLKPANLMVTPSGQIKIMDFGIARVAGSEHLTTAGFMMGTPAYMAPEQVLGHEIDARADLYAMGVVLYRMTTSKLPFKGDTPFAMAQSQVNDPPTPIRLMRDGLPLWFELVLGRALSKAPSDRFQTADDFRETLRRGLAGLPIDPAPNAFIPPDVLTTTPRAIAIDTSPTGMPTTLGFGASGGHRNPSSGQMRTGSGSTGAGTTGATPHVPTPTGANPALAETVMTSTGAHREDMAQTVMGPATNPALAETVMAGTGGVPIGQTGATRGSTGQNAALAGVPPVPPIAHPPAAAAGPAKFSSAGAAGAKGAKKPNNQNVLIAVGVGVFVIAVVAGGLWYRSRSSNTPTETPPPVASTTPTPDATPTPTDTPAPTATAANTSPTPGAATPRPSSAPVAANADPTRGTPTPAPTAAGTPGATPTSTAAPTATPTPGHPADAVNDQFVEFPDVKFIKMKDNKGDNLDVHLTFAAGQIAVMPDQGGGALVTIPYKNLKYARFLHGKDPTFDAGFAVPPDGAKFPHGSFGGDSNWLVLQTKTAWVAFRINDKTITPIIDVIQVRTGIQVDRPAGGGK